MTTQELIKELSDEADLCRNDGANDIADLLDKAVKRLGELEGAVIHAIKFGEKK